MCISNSVQFSMTPLFHKQVAIPWKCQWRKIDMVVTDRRWHTACWVTFSVILPTANFLKCNSSYNCVLCSTWSLLTRDLLVIAKFLLKLQNVRDFTCTVHCNHHYQNGPLQQYHAVNLLSRLRWTADCSGHGQRTRQSLHTCTVYKHYWQTITQSYLWLSDKITMSLYTTSALHPTRTLSVPSSPTDYTASKLYHQHRGFLYRATLYTLERSTCWQLCHLHAGFSQFLCTKFWNNSTKNFRQQVTTAAAVCLEQLLSVARFTWQLTKHRSSSSE